MLKITRKTLRSETGAVPLLEVVLLVAVLGLAGFAVLQGYKARHTSNQVSKPVPHLVKQSPSPSSTPKDETANWETYTSALEGLSIKYPQDWDDTNRSSYTSLGAKNEGLIIRSPYVSLTSSRISIYVQVGAVSADQHLTYDNPPNAPSSNSSVYKVEALDAGGPNRLFMVVTKNDQGLIDGLAVTDRSDIAPGSHFSASNLHFTSKYGNGRLTTLQGFFALPYQSGDQAIRPAYLTDNQYQAPTIQVVEKILKSLSYR
jgi:hypothetical protein